MIATAFDCYKNKNKMALNFEFKSKCLAYIGKFD